MKRRFGGECAALRAEGEFAFRSKDYVKAYGLLKENADRSGDPYDHYRLAEVALKLRRDVEAERHLTLAIAADPTKYHYWSLRAAIRQKAGDVPLAIQDLQAALDAAPGNTQVRSRLSALLSQTQRVDELVQLWRNAERDRPQDPAVLEALARALFAAGDFEPAVECARRSYEIAPTRTSIRAFLRERDPDGPIAGDSER
jgi:tetratricopeptide (TPR) repeat protein